MEWVRGEILGHGSFGTVSLAKPRSQSGHNIPQLMAVKSCGVSSSASLVNEKAILDEFKDCLEIIQCYGDSYSFENGEKLYNLFLQYASGGALADKVKNSSNHSLPENEVRRYAKSILRGLNCIHKNGFVHCDIKLQNILLDQDGAVKIADFGLAKRAGLEKDGNLGCELRGTPAYMSPEMVSRGHQSPPADIWALGCLVAEMVTGAPAWRCSDVARLLMKIGVGDEVPEIPGKLSEEGKDFIRKCFVKDPKKRWTAEMLLHHPFVSNHDDEDDRCTVTLKEVSSTSPRSAFDFPDYVSQKSSLTSSTISLSLPVSSPDSHSWFSGQELNSFGGSWSNSPPEDRLRGLISDQQLGWFDLDAWITVR